MASSLIHFGALQLTPEARAKLEHLLSNPKTRAAVSRKINAEGRELEIMCTQLAERELHRRSEDRRTDLSKESETHYIDSFRAVPAREDGLKLRVVIRNTHPAHPFVEKGTKPHQIEAKNHWLVFPYTGKPEGHGGPGFLAPWLVEREGIPFVGAFVQHPGAVKHEIMRRTLREYRRRAQRRLA